MLSGKWVSGDPLRDAPSPGKGLRNSNGEALRDALRDAKSHGEATAPVGEQGAQQTLALAERAEKKEEAEKQHNKENAPMQEAEEIAPNAVGQ